MKTFKVATAFLTSLTIVWLSVLPMVTAQTSQEQNQATALMRGYRTGYSDGYQEGVADVSKSANREFHNKSEYDKADRAFNPAWGAVEEYRDGYRQGYEAGYNAAYDHKPFDSSIPPDLTRKTEDSTVQYPIDPNKKPGDPNKQPSDPNDQTNTQTNNQTSNQTTNNQTTTQTDNTDPNGPLVLPRDTILRVELMNNLSTATSQKGDPFQARVIEPGQFQGAILDGHLQQVKRPGKAKGTAELQLAFEKITLNNRSAKLVAQVIEVIKSGSDQGVGKVDSEGGVNGSDSTKSDVKKVGMATGIGAALGAIFGGGVGAAVGATMGAGVGTAGVLTQRGKDIFLGQGQHLRIRTNADAEIQ
jgi:flagellar biosynthesis/type III secretory pathway protein FliH